MTSAEAARLRQAITALRSTVVGSSNRATAARDLVAVSHRALDLVCGGDLKVRDRATLLSLLDTALRTIDASDREDDAWRQAQGGVGLLVDLSGPWLARGRVGSPPSRKGRSTN